MNGWIFLGLVFVLCFLAACSEPKEPPQPTPTPEPTATVAPTPQPTEEPAPSPSPPPTETSFAPARVVKPQQ
jgi:hypothetical protein